MKDALCFSMFASILALGAPSAYAKPHAHKKPSTLSAPKAALDLELPPDEVRKRPRSSYWLAADPHVPLAVVEGKAIRSVGQRGKECGSTGRWATPHSRWHAVDAWGQTSGLFELTGS